jgi:hypothetical protein
MMARIGIERNMPGIPQSALPAMTTMMENSALILTFEATIFGTM